MRSIGGIFAWLSIQPSIKWIDVIYMWVEPATLHRWLYDSKFYVSICGIEYCSSMTLAHIHTTPKFG